jgi:hypothetical protein
MGFPGKAAMQYARHNSEPYIGVAGRISGLVDEKIDRDGRVRPYIRLSSSDFGPSCFDVTFEI